MDNVKKFDFKLTGFPDEDTMNDFLEFYQQEFKRIVQIDPQVNFAVKHGISIHKEFAVQFLLEGIAEDVMLIKDVHDQTISKYLDESRLELKHKTTELPMMTTGNPFLDALADMFADKMAKDVVDHVVDLPKCRKCKSVNYCPLLRDWLNAHEFQYLEDVPLDYQPDTQGKSKELDPAEVRVNQMLYT